MTEKIRDDANNAKIRGAVENPEAPDRQIILHAKHVGSWITMWGYYGNQYITCGYIIPWGFFVYSMIFPPLIFKKNVTTFLSPFFYIT